MNIFETIGSVSGGIERYHSQFLADALEESLSEDRSLFDGVWCLATPDGWEPPDCAEISTEEAAGKGRIDICIRSDHPVKRIVGIEVKTVDESADFEQLKEYLCGLRNTYSEHCVQISYLTPFNRCRADVNADILRTVRVFDEFSEVSPAAQHLSWLDVADIDWDGNDLWKQHQAYVRKNISSGRKLTEASADRDRGLDAFFDKKAAQEFLDKLDELGFQCERHRMQIDLSKHPQDLSSFAEKLVNAIEILLNTENVSPRSKRSDKIAEELRELYLKSPYTDVHVELFRLSERFSHVWVQGEGNYGVRTALKDPRFSSGVSLITSQSHDRLVVVLQR